MALMPREAVVRVLQTLLANTEADASRSSASRDWFDGRASGIKSALNVLTADEDDLLPPLGEGTRKYS